MFEQVWMWGEPREIRLLTSAFNDMIVAIQNSNKHLEETITQRTDELKRSEARHLTLFNTTASAVMVLDHETIIDCNPAAISVFGARDRADLIGRHPAELSPPQQRNGGDSLALSRQENPRRTRAWPSLFRMATCALTYWRSVRCRGTSEPRRTRWQRN